MLSYFSFMGRANEHALARWDSLEAEGTPAQLIARSTVVLALLGLIALFDALSGPDIHLYVFYLVPILLATAQLGPRIGVTLCLACVVINASASWMNEGRFGLAEWVTAAARLLVSLLVVAGWWRLHAMGVALAKLSLADALTGLPNRRACILRGEAELARARRSGEPLSLLFLDLDDFKSVNDELGHKTGDVLLCSVGTELRSLIRESDFAARLGGDEFVVLLPSTGSEGGRRIGEAVHGRLRELFASRSIRCGASIGVTTFPNMPEKFDQVIQSADELMYQMKRAGKDGVLQRDAAGYA